MNVARRLLAACSLLATCCAFGQVTLIHEYALQGSLADSLGGPALTSLGGIVTSNGYTFGPNQGLAFNSQLFTPDSFSIELSFNFASVNGYRKIADFLNLRSDTGFYVLNGQLNYFNFATGSATDFAPGVSVDVALTRDSVTKTVTGYVNGVQRFSFNDTASNAVLANGPLRLFVDDINTSQGEASAGTLNYFRVFSGTLSGSEVNALYLSGGPVAVPEPSTVMLLVVGGLGIFGWNRRSRAGKIARNPRSVS